jgi:hypothetical protein
MKWRLRLPVVDPILALASRPVRFRYLARNLRFYKHGHTKNSPVVF